MPSRHSADGPPPPDGDPAAGRDSGALALPSHWRLLRTPPASGVRNMALDVALLEHARTTGDAVWRCYAWQQPTVSFGRNETVRGRFDAASLARAGLDAVRRPTGGRALLHAREVTYSAVLPLAPQVPWRTAYAAVNAILLDALRALGVDATLVSDADGASVRPDGPLCFDQPAAGEIAVAGAKLVGSAVWRERGAYLQHGSILLHDDQARLADARLVDATRPQASPPPAASLDACRRANDEAPLSWSDVADALEAAIARRATVSPFALSPAFAEHVARSERDIAHPDWLWRR